MLNSVCGEIRIRMSLSLVAFGFITDCGHGAYWKLSMKTEWSDHIKAFAALPENKHPSSQSLNVCWHRQCLLMLVQVTLSLLPHL